MAGRRTDVLDIREIIRRFRLEQGDRAIARETGIDRKTVAIWRDWAEGQGFLVGDAMPDEAAIAERMKATEAQADTGPESSVEKWRGLVIEKRKERVELKALLGILREHDFKGSYSALRRFVARIDNRAPEVFVRVETAPGEEAQVDFFYAGIFADDTGRLRKAWVFVMTMSWSRHVYVEAVFDQKIETWCGLHARAFSWFGGVVRKIKLDNLKAGIVEAVMHDPVAQRSYRDLATHYGFLISPCRPRTPRHKGKVESNVHYVERNALAGRTFANLRALNEYLIRWAMEVAGVRDHGTTHEPPLERFEKEKAVLLPLPVAPYEISTWKKAKVHTDGHVVLDGSYYSAPCRLVGQEIWLRATPSSVEIHHEHERITTHARASRRGQRMTLRDHLPPEKVQGLDRDPIAARAKAVELGPSAVAFVDRLLDDRPMDRIDAVKAVFRLAEKHGAARLNAACARALAFDEIKVHGLKRILKLGLDVVPLDDPAIAPAPLPATSQFARPFTDFLPVNTH